MKTMNHANNHLSKWLSWICFFTKNFAFGLSLYVMTSYKVNLRGATPPLGTEIRHYRNWELNYL